MLEEAPEDRAHADILGDSWDAGPERADAAHDQVDLDPGVRGLVERLDDARLDQRVHLGDDPRRPAGEGVLGLARDAREERVVQRERRLQQLSELRGPRQARHLQEELVQVLADRLIAGKQAVVGIGARGARVVVAGADVAVAPQLRVLAPDDQDQLRMRLVADDAVHHVRARRLQARGELDVGGLIEARHQLDDDRHVLAGARGLDQRIDDRGVGARPV